jgi:hypothetical protein
MLVGATTATAASLITSADIKNNTIRGKDVGTGTLTLRNLSPSTVRSLRARRGSPGPQGAQGVPGIPGATGAKGTTDIFYVDGAAATVNPGDSGFSDAFCPAGSVATGGALGPASDALFNDAVFFGVEGSRFFVEIGNADTVPHTIQARAACARR